jgi:hypothetical protein
MTIALVGLMRVRGTVVVIIYLDNYLAVGIRRTTDIGNLQTNHSSLRQSLRMSRKRGNDRFRNAI